MIAEHSFGVWIVCISCTVFELCLMKKKKERRKKTNKIKIFVFNFLDREEKSLDSGGYILHKNS